MATTNATVRPITLIDVFGSGQTAVSKRFVVFNLLIMLAWTAVAQQFSVSVVVPTKPRVRDFTLLIYDTDSLPRVLKSSERKSVVFTGMLHSGAAYAELHYRNAARPLHFFIENSDITIGYNADNPEASPINGSRLNSIFRYQIEQCGESDVECLTRFIVENPTSPVAPYILDRYIVPSGDYEMAEQIYNMMSGDACNAFHYKQLARRLKAQKTFSPGNPLPDVEVAFLKGKPKHLDSLVVGNKTNVILIGASYCRQCNDAKSGLDSIYPEMNVIAFDVDSLSGGWDAPLLRKMDVDHIPFLLVVGADGRIMARDARLWELGRIVGVAESKEQENREETNPAETEKNQ